MPEVNLHSLDARLQKQADKASRAIERGNPSYAIDICMGILKRNPECLDVRKILRKAQYKALSAKNKILSSFLSGIMSVPFLIRSHGFLKKDPRGVMEVAERLLNINPRNSKAHRLLAQAAQAMRLKETAVFAYETIRNHEPENTKNLLALGHAYIAVNRNPDAIKVGSQILNKEPVNGEAQELIRVASVERAIEEGNWKEEGDYQSKLKDEREAAQLEEENRVVSESKALYHLIEQAKSKIEQEPDNIIHYREISRRYQQMGDLDNALRWIRKAREMPTGRADPTLERAEVNLSISRLELIISEKKRILEHRPNDATLKAELKAEEEKLKQFSLEQTRGQVEKYPNDYFYRFDYGKLLFQDGKFEEAAKQFQFAQRNPKVRLRALFYLGKCFKKGHKFDLAANQFSTAKQEISTMDDLKKEIIYELADCYEQMGDQEKAIAEYKIIYTSDIGYRDVANKINTHYENL